MNEQEQIDKELDVCVTIYFDNKHVDTCHWYGTEEELYEEGELTLLLFGIDFLDDNYYWGRKVNGYCIYEEFFKPTDEKFPIGFNGIMVPKFEYIGEKIYFGKFLEGYSPDGLDSDSLDILE